MSAVTCNPCTHTPKFSEPKRVKALHHVKRMRGSSQSHLMLCSDGNLYIVKFRNNPQHRRVLCDEILGTYLAQLIGLPVPPLAIVEVGEKLIRESPSLRIEFPGATVLLEPGRHFGSRHVLTGLPGEVFDLFPTKELHRVSNLDAFAGAIAFDLWTCNSDERQALFTKLSWMQDYFVTFIDQGNCFGGQDWDMPSSLWRGLYNNLEVYSSIHAWTDGDPFSPWDRRILKFDPELLRKVCAVIPETWYDNQRGELGDLADLLLIRRQRVWGLLQTFREQARALSPKCREYGLHKLLPFLKGVHFECSVA